MQRTKGIVAAGHKGTAEAAAAVLREGGNAFDAGVAAFLASFVAEPCMSSAGGGAFMTAYKSDGTARVYDFFVQTPQRKLPMDAIECLPVTLDFGTAKEIFHVGMGSVGVPGAVAGLFQIHKDLGSLPMSVLAEPAIELARKGVEVDSFQYHDFGLLEPILSLTKPSPVFWKENRLIRAGERIVMPELADCLELLVREGSDAFYKGDIAKKLLQLNQDKGGHLTQSDLDAYTVGIRKPLEFRYRDRKILTNPLPSLGGSMIAIMLAMLEDQGLVDYAPCSTSHVQRLMTVASAIDTIPRTPKDLAEHLSRWFPEQSSPVQHQATKIGGTSHFNILDAEGNAVAISTSIGEGCGHFIPGTGIILNNMLGELALLPHGLHSWEEDVRLGSMMSPTVVLDHEGCAEVVIGSGGAGRIPSMIAQVLHYLIDHNKDVHSAVGAPRLHWINGVCNLEPGLPTNVPAPESLKQEVAWDEQSLYFGGTHTILRQGHQMEAVGDPRRGGVMLQVD